jgi:uncharacterized membrane-anchored protein YitT (DUF2179 family)
MKIDKKVLMDYLYVTLGTFLLGFAIISFWSQHNLVTGGISGLAIIIYYYTESAGFSVPIPIWLSNLVLNLPLFIIGFKVVPREYFFRSIYGYLMLTVSLYVLRYVPPIPSDLLMSGIFGGVIAGIGIGFVLRARATTGGSTLIAAILHRWGLRHISMAKILFCIDSTIILIGLLVFGPNAAMYAVVAVFVATKVTDTVLEGLSFSKAAFIISQEANAIADGITKDMNRGVTEVSSRGRYSGQDQTMLLCVVPAKEIVTLKQLVYNLDKKAFVIVTDVREVLGEGFKAGQDW